MLEFSIMHLYFVFILSFNPRSVTIALVLDSKFAVADRNNSSQSSKLYFLSEVLVVLIRQHHQYRKEDHSYQPPTNLELVPQAPFHLLGESS